MHTVLSRPQPLGTGTSSSHRIPRKSASFLSLRREKEKPSLPSDPYNSNIDSSHSRPSYFEAYPRPKTAQPRSSKSKAREAYSTPQSPIPPEDSTFSDQTIREKKGTRPPALVEQSSYFFPSTEISDYPLYPSQDTQSSSKPHSRIRSRTGPSRQASNWADPTPVHRFSGSSTQHTDTPPDTPLDNVSFREFSVMVAAPISTVEAMDALVDNMNGGEDIISASLSSRARFGIPGHHPLYQPPLPTPPPGIVLGGGKVRRSKKSSKASAHRSSYSGDEEDETLVPHALLHKRRPKRLGPSRSSSNATITSSTPATPSPLLEDEARTPSPVPPARHRPVSPDSVGGASLCQERPKSIAPSISEIIRAYAPPEAQGRSRTSLTRTSSYVHSHGHATLVEESEPDSEPLTLEEEADLLSRSSIDSVADEVQRTLRNQNAMKPAPTPPPPPPSSFAKRLSTISADNASICSPRSDGGTASIYSMSVTSSHPPPSFETTNLLASLSKPSPAQAVAQYLRSGRLTTLLKLTRSPHASSDNPLTVSLSDLGSPTGIPVVVFLGLGCVRHIMGLYDEMAECMGLRLVTIDRWGLGRTEPRAKSAKGIMQWASVVEEVLDLLHIDQCSVMAHSAGAPYALSFANKLSQRIRGDICLLAPWVGGSESGGYKWLKYVPNGILKTAQAADWKLQAWMIGKPPTIAYEGIGYDFRSPSSKGISMSGSPPVAHGNMSSVYPSSIGNRPRPSMTSSTFSEYDDLGDFDGRFESRSTLGVDLRPTRQEATTKRKNSRSFLHRFKAPSHSQPQSPTEDDKASSGRRLKALRSMGSLKSKSSKVSENLGPQLPPALKFEVGLGFDDPNWTKAIESSQTSLVRGDRSLTPSPDKFSTTGHIPYPRANGRRSLSFNTSRGATSLPASPVASVQETFSSNQSFSTRNGPNHGYQATLANALIAASHSESAKGTHNDLLQILNHDNHPWGFSYTSYPHKVNVWYGDRDEKIAEHAVRWMERNMGEDKCTVKVVKGADHGLMYKSSVVVEVLEHVLSYWQPGHL
ncbi:uncharacterized protein BT62DRAFT_927630 [Guyanagaster necrorhizus]|uniref:Alpha/beta-hydrolase n=1 Tax=Guyanagaster necrorhizus TaxID=856835 RepID=A0A9P7W178_9AGAR|nr:uncharacterized protein BT62DRAFT_927630 [Guyanagaster necrorhizus MCA 3950]KAG7450312.1 hypothetical protein BT62DRAFT_927630 [Guyanagaster necrorhizus MCA 3950]